MEATLATELAIPAAAVGGFLGVLLTGVLMRKRVISVTRTVSAVPVETIKPADYEALHKMMNDLNEQSKDLDRFPVGSYGRAELMARLNAARDRVAEAQMTLASTV